MKKGTVILGSIIGGAILGTALTLCITSEKGKDMRKMAHEKILAQIDYLQQQIKGCSCSMDGEDKMAQMGEKVKEKVDEVKQEVKAKMDNMMM